MKRIALYCDEGASPSGVRAIQQFLSAFSVHLIKADFFVSDNWGKNTDLLIFPGGRDLPYQQALQGSYNQSIVQFVQDGGKFLGICAGGYFASQSIVFEKGGPLQIIQDRELGFFPGVAEGPIYGLGKFAYDNPSGMQIAKLRLPSIKNPICAYYNGGCAFIEADSKEGIEVLAHYSDIEGSPAAIIKAKLGKGIAILSGVHPEYEPSDPRLFPYILKQLELTSFV